jgi:hypothetical protein
VLERIEENRVNGDKMDRYNYNKELGTSEREKERKGKRKSFSITPTLQRKLQKGRAKEGQKAKTRVFTSVPQEEAFDLLFVDKTR